MGGAAFLIHGTFDESRAAASAPRTLIGRLLGRTPPSVSSLQLPSGRTLLEFPAGAIRRTLPNDYLSFVRGALSQPSASSAVVLEYLRLGQPSIYLRAERAPGEASGPSYVQVSFSGAAGMAETSARVAVHWAAHWYAARGVAIAARILAPAGFRATRADAVTEMAFAPAGEYGYAEREDASFTIDAAFLESHDDPDGLLGDLERQYGAELAAGVCRCQLCAPGT